MGGFFGVASKKDCVFDLFFGIDYHSHLGTKRGGMAVYGEGGFERSIHNIENSPFRTKFEHDIEDMNGPLGIGCISDNEPQPLIVRSHLGNFAITTVGRINNTDALVELVFHNGAPHFLEMSGGDINQTELVAALINQKDSIVEGIQYAQQMIDGSMSMLILTPECIYAARDRLGRTPIAVGKKKDAYCVAFECFSYLNLGYKDYRILGPAEIVKITADKCETVAEPQKEMRICSFLWVYYGYTSSSYEGINVEAMRYRCGALMSTRDNDGITPDTVSGVPDSGTAHAIGYANASGILFSRPFIKYTPTWPRSFMPQKQSQRNFTAKMKLIPVNELINGKKLLLIDDSIVRGTQARETTDFLYETGAKEVHFRTACPPIMFGCKYLNFSRFTSDMDLFTRRTIAKFDGNPSPERLAEYCNPDSPCYAKMVDDICHQLHFTTLKFNRADDVMKAIGLEPCKLCTYCFNGRE